MQNTKSFSTPRESVNLVHESNLRRYQLLRYRDVMRLSDVMETVVPIHGTGNFPTLDIEPYRLVQVCLPFCHCVILIMFCLAEFLYMKI